MLRDWEEGCGGSRGEDVPEDGEEDVDKEVDSASCD